MKHILEAAEEKMAQMDLEIYLLKQENEKLKKENEELKAKENENG